MRYKKSERKGIEGSLCSKLVQLRLLNNYSQEYVAKRIGKARSTYGNYENGYEEPGASAILALAELYGITPNDILCDDLKVVTFEISNFDQKALDFLIKTYSYLRNINE